MVVCPDCGKEVPDAKFCKNCGARLPEIQDVTQVVNHDEVIIENNASQANDEFIETKTKSINYCSNCGNEINGNFRFCPNCGYDLENKTSTVRNPSGGIVNSSEEKNIILAIILSVIFPGLGQFYLGLSRKGAIFLFAYVISAVLCLLIIGVLLVIVVWIWALVDTIQSTNALNSGESVEDKLL